MLMQKEMSWATVTFSLICVCVSLCVYCVVCMFVFLLCEVSVSLCMFGPPLADLFILKLCVCVILGNFFVCDMGACIFKCVCVCVCVCVCDCA